MSLAEAGWEVLRQPTTGMESERQCAPAGRGVTDLPDHPHVLTQPVQSMDGSWVTECFACGIRLVKPE